MLLLLSRNSRPIRRAADRFAQDRRLFEALLCGALAAADAWPLGRMRRVLAVGARHAESAPAAIDTQCPKEEP